MFNRLTSLTLFVPIATAAFIPNCTYAQTSDICTFTQTDFGTLIAEGKTLPTKLTNYGEKGNPMQITVTCNQPVKITVSQPIQTSGPIFNPISALATVQTPTGYTSSSSGASKLSLPAGMSNLVINLFIDKGSPLEVGNYKYGVKFTILP
ncbi:hypothetical protein RIVM261_060540 [Rivularia sp. IAM M-261]|nr:hypothetical protein RIVM261_060540 [Rivularia sp. IAM M-261]